MTKQHTGWFADGRRKWVTGMAAVVVAVGVGVSIPMLNDSADPVVDNPGIAAISDPAAGGNAGGTSQLSELITTDVDTVEDADELFIGDLLAPDYIPEGYELVGLQAIGMDEDEATRVHFNYQSGEKPLTLTADTTEPAFNMDAFEDVEVNGATGHILAQTGLTELYWAADGVTYSIVGPVSEEEALKIAESMQ